MAAVASRVWSGGEYRSFSYLHRLLYPHHSSSLALSIQTDVDLAILSRAIGAMFIPPRLKLSDLRPILATSRCQLAPEWAGVGRSGPDDGQMASVFGRYGISCKSRDTPHQDC